MGREENVAREEPQTNWWDAIGKDRLFKFRQQEPTTYRVWSWESEEKVNPEAIEKALAEADPLAVVTLPAPTTELKYQDVIAHEVGLADGALICKKIVGVGTEVTAWEIVAIFPAGSWSKMEAVKYRESV